MITIIVIFQLKGNVNLDDPTSQTSKIIREALTLEVASHGAHHAYYGQSIEKPETGIMFVNWDSVDDHNKFTASSNYPICLTHLQSIADDKTAPTILTVPFNPSGDPSAALGANKSVGVTEIVFSYFPSSLTRTERDTAMSSVDKMRPVMERSESLATFDGWAIEEAVRNPGPQASEGEESQVFVTLVGWADVEAHMHMQRSEDFQENIHHLLGIKEMRHSEFFHAKMHAV